MSASIKKFNINYFQVPQVFDLSPNIYPSTEAERIPNDSLEQTDAQKKQIKKTIDQIHLDAHKTCYLDFEGAGIAPLKKDRLITNHDNDLCLAPGIYPSFTQGDSSAACISQIIFTKHFFLPLLERDESQAISTSNHSKKISFAYRNAYGQLAGFSIVAIPDVGFIIATIQNKTAHPKDKKVTVLGTKHFITTDANETVFMDNEASIHTELSAAIQNDQVTALIKGIFNQDGSLNAEYLLSLHKRIQPNQNLDNRDEKMAHLMPLFGLAKELQLEEVLLLQADYENQRAINIHFFAEPRFSEYYTQLIQALAQGIKQKKNTTQSIEQMQWILDKTARNYAIVLMQAACFEHDRILSGAYAFKAQEIMQQFLALTFDDSPIDNLKQDQLHDINPLKIDDAINRFYKTNPAIKKYHEQKDRRNIELSKKLNAVPKPEHQSVLKRHQYSFIAGSVTALIVGLAVGFAFLPILPIIASVFLGLSLGLVCGAIPLGVGIHLKEKKLTNQRADYLKELKAIRDENIIQAQKALNDVLKEIPASLRTKEKTPDCVLGLNKKKAQITPEYVAFSLWLKDKGPKATVKEKCKFTLWAEKNHIPFGIHEVNAVIEKKYVMKHLNIL